MKKFLYVTLAMVLVALVACNSISNSPADTGKQFYTLIINGKVNDAYGMISKSGQKMLENYAGGAAALSTKTKQAEENGGMKEIQVVSEEVKGDTAVVNLKIIFNSGNPIVNTLDLIKEDGKWKIAINK